MTCTAPDQPPRPSTGCANWTLPATCAPAGHGAAGRVWPCRQPVLPGGARGDRRRRGHRVLRGDQARCARHDGGAAPGGALRWAARGAWVAAALSARLAAGRAGASGAAWSARPLFPAARLAAGQGWHMPSSCCGAPLATFSGGASRTLLLLCSALVACRPAPPAGTRQGAAAACYGHLARASGHSLRLWRLLWQRQRGGDGERHGERGGGGRQELQLYRALLPPCSVVLFGWAPCGPMCTEYRAAHTPLLC